MDERVGSQTPSNFSALLGCRALKKEPLLPKTPALEHAARWWPSILRRRPHRQAREDKGRKRRRHNHNLNGWDFMRVVGLVGDTVTATDARRPRCDRIKAFSALVRVGHNVVKNCPSKQLAARCCHPNWGSSGSVCKSLVGCVGEDPPRSHDQACFTEGVCTIPHCPKTMPLLVDSNQHHFCGPCSATESQTTSGNEKSDSILAKSGAPSMPRMTCKHRHTLRSSRSTKFWTLSGRAKWNQKLERVAPHIKNNNQVAWESCTNGIRWKSVSCSTDFPNLHLA